MDTTPENSVQGLASERTEGYKRTHFFKHFLTEEDWNARHNYHLQKNLLHMQFLHGEGIYDGLHRLLVRAHAKADLGVDVTPGYATDIFGHVMTIEENYAVPFELEKFQLPTTLYIKLIYQEMASDRIRMKDGTIQNKYFRETFRIIVSDKVPKENQLELARVAVTEDCKAILNPADPYHPKENEIDMRFRLNMPNQNNIDMGIRLNLLKLLNDRRNAFERIGGNMKLPEMALFSQDFAIMSELIESNTLKESAVPGIMAFFKAFDDMMLQSVKETIPLEILDRPEWARHVDNCRAYGQFLTDTSKPIEQRLSMAIVQLEKLSISYAHVTRLIGNDRRVYIPGQVKPLPRSYPITSNWDFIKVWSAEMPQIFKVDDLDWLLIGELNITDEASEKKYRFRINEARDMWRYRQRLYFPDGALIEDTGVAQEGGYCEFDIPFVIPDTHLLIIRMMDYARADYELLINVNGQDAGISKCDGYDRDYRWRNWPFVVPSYFVNDTSLKIRQTCITADRDINMFRYWFYQPTNW